MVIEELEKTYRFTYAQQLIFSDPLLKQKVEHLCLCQEVPIQAASYGKRYDQELLLGLEALSEIRWINEEVGYGLYNSLDIPTGTFIGEYTGLVCPNNPYYKINNYCFNYPILKSDQALSIDAEPCGNRTRFINHSFHPNLDILYAFHQGLYHVILVANQEVKKGEQFSYNYGHSYWYLRGAPYAFT